MTVTALTGCEGACNITGATVVSSDCDEENAGQFFVTLNVQHEGAGTSWHTLDGHGQGEYGTDVQLAQSYPSNGQVFTITIVDDENPDCTQDVTVTALTDCFTECEISYEILSTQCDDRGTPTPDDDLTIFTVNITGSGTSGCWLTDNGLTNDYGQSTIILPADGSDHTITIFDCANASCSTTLELHTTQPCSEGECSLGVEMVSLDCDTDNIGTFYVELLVSNTGAGTTWHTEDGHGAGTYGVASIVSGYDTDSDGGMMTIVVVDDENPDCRASIDIAKPSNCDEDCSMMPSVETKVCDDNGTPDDPTDDTYSFYFKLEGGNVGYGWHTNNPVVSDMIGGNGVYGVLYHLGPFPVGVNTNFNAYDNLNEYCAVAAYVQSTGPCTPDCDISASIVDNICHDNGTPDDTSDDYYTVSVSVTRNITGGSWIATYADGSEITTGSYGTPTNLGPFTSPVQVVITDTDNDECTTDLPLMPPAVEFECPDDTTVGINPDNNQPYDLICSDLDDILNNGDSFEVTGAPVIINGCGFDRIDFVDQLISNEDCEDALIRRTFYIVGIGGSVATCTQDITIRMANVNDVANSLSQVDLDCTSTYELDANGNPSPTVTGYPSVTTAFGVHELAPDYCNLSATYTDETTSICGGAVTITRTWTITDDCDLNASLQMEQLIVIGGGDGAIVVECPLSNHYCPILDENIMLFETDPFSCTATVEIPLPEVTVGECSEGLVAFTVTIEIIDANNQVVATIQPGGNRVLEDVDPGDYTIRYTVTDDCGLSVTHDCIFRVADLDAPVAVCNNGFNLSLGGYGLARVYAAQIDFGSYDNCGIASIEIRREYTRDPVTCDTLIEDQVYFSEWGDYVDFSCCDAGTYVTVEMRVTDAAGNVNTCWSEILIEDKTLPLCYGLENVSISCSELPEDFDAYDIGVLTTMFGAADVIDNCSAYAVELEPVVALTDCGSGTITRRFTAFDLVGNEAMEVFEQIITVEPDMTYAIRFPRDAETDCIHSADTLLIVNEACNNFEITFSDEYLPTEGEECYNVLRTYHVINTCEWDGIAGPVNISRDEDCDGLEGEEDVWVIHNITSDYVDMDDDPMNGTPAANTKGTACDGATNPVGYWRTVNSTGYWTYTQHLVIYDTIVPQVEFEVPMPFCADTAVCETEIAYPFTITENCITDDIVIEILLDLDANGSIDMDLTNSGVLTGTYPNYTITGTYPIGNHFFRITVRDGCGNDIPALLPFQVVDCYIPEMTCYSGLIVNLEALEPGIDIDGDGIDDAGAVEVQAGLLASCEVTDCSDPLRYSVNRLDEMPDPDQSSIFLTCDDRYSVQLEVYLWDSAFNPYAVQPDGTVGGPNYTHCEVTVYVQDPDEICDNCCPEQGEIHGRVATPANKPVKDVIVTLTNDNVSVEEDLTESDGLYDFVALSLNQDYEVVPEKDTDYRNGVTTMDIIVIQRHLLGIELFHSPYQYLAADVNNSGTVTTLDLIEIRRLLLGDIDEFGNMTSWRFVPKDYEFPNPNNPWEYSVPQTITVGDLAGSVYHMDFVAVKVGDVNLSANPNQLTDNEIEDRSQGLYEFEIQDRTIEKGEIIEVPFIAPSIKSLEGYQFTLNFDRNALIFAGVASGVVGQSEIGLSKIDRGLITSSWNTPSGLPVEGLQAAPVLFVMTFEAKVSGLRLSELFELSSDALKAEGYVFGEGTVDLGIAFTNTTTSAVSDGEFVFEMFQNVPNPFNDQTVVGFELPSSLSATLTIRDMTGKEVLTIEGDYEQGYNEIALTRESLPSGVYYYTLNAGKYTATKRMIIAR